LGQKEETSYDTCAPPSEWYLSGSTLCRGDQSNISTEWSRQRWRRKGKIHRPTAALTHLRWRPSSICPDAASKA
jgi:hypothetical protein